MITFEDQIVKNASTDLIYVSAGQSTGWNGMECDLDIPARMLDQRQIGGKSILGPIQKNKLQ